MRKAILGLAPLLLAMGSGAAAQAPTWRVSEVSGDVRIVENGRSRAVTRGTLLSSGSTIATAARSRAVLVRGQEYVVVSPSSRLRVPDQQQGRGGVIQMLADWGTALFRIERRATPHFGVQTPYLAAVVKGTVFTVTVGEAGASVQVTEGAVEVSTLDAGAAELVTPGEVVNVSAADLQQLNVEGETTRAIRSDGTPLPGVVTIPAPQAGVYEGPSAAAIEVTAMISEGAVSLSQTTGGLLDGNVGYDLALANLVDQGRGLEAPVVAEPSTPAGPVDGSDRGGGSSGGSDAGVGAGAGSGSSSGGSGSDSGSSGGGSSAGGSGSDSGGSDSGSGVDPSDPGSGGPGVDPAVPGSGDTGAGPGDPGDGDPGVDPSGPGGAGPGDPGGDDDGGIGVCLPGDLLCVGVGGPADGGSGDGGDDDGGIGVCLPGDLLCVGVGGPGGGDDGDDSGAGGADDNDGGIGICLPGDLLCVGVGGPAGGGDDGDDGSGPGDPGAGGDDDDGGIGICLPGDLLCIGLGGPGGSQEEDDGGSSPLCILFCRND